MDSLQGCLSQMLLSFSINPLASLITLVSNILPLLGLVLVPRKSLWKP